MNIPDIKIQLIHIDGPLKGEINEFCQEVVTLGRHPDSQIVFPESCGAISREHAKIIREGNRFKLVDHSTNGTLVNGKEEKETFLKNGDVLIIGGKEGAKVSFLTQEISAEEAAGFQLKVTEAVSKSQMETPASPPPPNSGIQQSQRNQPRSPVQQAKQANSQGISQSQPEKANKQVNKQVNQQVKKKVNAPPVAKSLIVQHGAALNSFKQLPITIGSGSVCDLTLAHPGLLERHAQIFFQEDQYWIKDLTGRGLISVNMVPVESGMPLTADARLKLTPKGPEFTFLGEGRLAEVEQEAQQQMSTQPGAGKQNVHNRNVDNSSQVFKNSLVERLGGQNIVLWGVVAVLGGGLVLAALLIL